MIEAVIFDLDGTLVHLPINYQRLFKKFREIMKTKDIHPLTQKISRLDKQTRQKIYEIWDKAELAALGKVKVKDEGLTIYNKFSKMPKALVTMQGRAVVERIIEGLNLSFRFVATRECSLDRIEQLREAAMKLEKELGNILFVGDMENDSLAALEAGCRFLRIQNEDLV